MSRAAGWAALAVFVAALILALGPARVTEPEAVFPKYLAAAAAPAPEQAERLLDYSPLYLALTRLLAPRGWQTILQLQVLLHALTAALVALAVARLVGWRWGLAAGLGAASYRPFLVYAGVHEPETVIVLCLALAVFAGLEARCRNFHAAEQGVPSPWEGGGRSRGEARRGALRATPTLRPPPDTVPDPDRPPPDLPPVPTLPLPGGRDAIRASHLDGSASLQAGHPTSATPPGVAPLAWIFSSALALAAAGLARPQHLLLLPVWALWTGTGRPRREQLRTWAVVLATALVVVGPVLVSRTRALGAPIFMDPGPVFYEGNAVGAVGLIRFAPPAVLALERAHREAFDYGHVAYRRIAAAATGRPASSSSANRYWTGLALEGLRAHPAAGLRRLVRKAGLALMPYEGHDLENAERLDRRVRRLFPWGFALPAVALAWLPLARRARLASIAGPLAIALLAFLVQTGAYASARQRLPLALALWVVGPVLAADLVRGRLHRGARPALALLLGVGGAALLGAATGRVALLDQLGWDRVVGPSPGGWSERLVAWQEGRALRPLVRQDAMQLAAGIAALRSGRPDLALPHLAPLAAGQDLTVDERTVGVPAYQAALALLALGDREGARRAAAEARRARPEDPRVAALALRLADRDRFAAAAEGSEPWRPPGCDPVSARLALASAAAADRDREAGRALLLPLARDFPELAGLALGRAR